MRLYVIAAAITVAVFALIGTHSAAYNTGKNAGKIEQMKASVDAYRKRDGVDNEISKMDRVAVCVQLGGLRSDCEQLRRVEEAAAGEQPG